MKKIQIALFVLICIGIGLLYTQKKWVPSLTQHIVEYEVRHEQALSVINLSKKNLTTLSKSLFNDKTATTLNLSYNSLRSIPAEIGNMQNVTILSLSHNHLTTIPAEIGHLKKLVVLDLSYNELTGLPHELGDLSNLKILNVIGNNYSTQDLEYIKNKLPTSTQVITH